MVYQRRTLDDSGGGDRGPIADPRFYLTDKNLLIKGITQQDDFDW